MCFSATASFAAAALLLPLGLVTVRRTIRSPRPDLLPVALIPLGFGLQQLLEGLVWQGLGPGHAAAPERLIPLSLSYLFFAYALWPAWIPFCALCAAGPAEGSLRRPALRLLLLLGTLLGLLLWLPLLFDPARVGPELVGGSLSYGVIPPFAGPLPWELGPPLYVVIIGLPLLLVPEAGLRWFALSLVASSVIAQWWWGHTFSSVWCFFSALLSLQIVRLLQGACRGALPERLVPRI